MSRVQIYIFLATFICAPVLFLGALFISAQLYVVLFSCCVLFSILIWNLIKFKEIDLIGIDYFNIFFYMVIITNVIDLVSPYKVGGVLDLILIVVSFFACFVCYGDISKRPIMNYIIFAFFIAFSFGVISSFFTGWSGVKGAIYQSIYFFKWPLMLIVGFLCDWKENNFKKLYTGMWIYVVIVWIFILLEVLVPSFYKGIGINLLEFRHTANPFTAGLTTRGTGPFVHSSVLAFFSSIFLCFVFSDLLIQKNRENFTQRVFLVITMLFFIVFSGQQQEMMAAIICCALIVSAVFFRSMFRSIAFSLLILCSFLLVFFLLLGDAQLESLMSEWGFSEGYKAIISARPVFFSDSIYLANEHFPLGTGFGTFAGVGAKLFNRDLYSSLGYDFYWWYRQDIFLLDTYWPNFVSELGWIGAFFIMTIPAVKVYGCYSMFINSTEQFSKRICAYAFSAILFCTLVSITSPIYSDPSVVMFAFMLFGIAIKSRSKVSIKAHEREFLS